MSGTSCGATNHPAFLQDRADETTATHSLLGLRLELIRVWEVEQIFGPIVAEAVRDNVEVPITGWGPPGPEPDRSAAARRASNV
jgi:hypothetical protein